MYINEPRCDYIRLTTFDKTTAELMAEIVRDIHLDADPEQSNFLQYSGDRYEHGFNGSGLQGDYLHWLAHISGELSQTALDWFIEHLKLDSVKCTRLDLQVTVPLPASWNLREHVDHLREQMWPGRRRKVEFYENEGPGGTIYIGSRSSLKFARLYIKFSGSDEWPLCLRYEVELKGEVADNVFKVLAVEAANIGQCLRGEFERMPIVESESWLALERVLPATGLPLTLPVNLPDENKTIRWLLHKVAPTIRRMLNSHEHGYLMYSWLKDMVQDYERDNDETQS